MKGICKALRIKVRQQKTRRKPRKLCKRLEYVVVSESPRVLRLKNGTLLRQPVEGVDLYLSRGGRVYTLTRQGLRERHVDYTKKNNYCKKLMTGRGHTQGQAYPHIEFRGKKYWIHTMMAIVFKGGIGYGEVADHINGDIDDFSYDNIRVITIEENNWCCGILRRLRNAARKLDLPYMNPKNRTQEDMLEVFDRFKGRDVREALEEEIERQKVLHALIQASRELHDPTLDPRKMTKKRREEVLRKYRVVDPATMD